MEAGRHPWLARGGKVRPARQVRVDMTLALRNLRHRRDAVGPTTSSSTLVYRTVTKTTPTGTVETVIAMPKPLHIVFPEGFTRTEMAGRVAAVAKIAKRKRHVRARLSRPAYLAATRKPRLPPTPIANPGLASMQAAAHPAHVNYLYFVRKPDKKHHFFTASFKAFQAYAAAHGYGGP